MTVMELVLGLYLYSQLHLYLYVFCNMEGSSSCFEVGNGFVFVFKVAFVFVYKQVFAILRPVVELVMDSSVLSASLCTPCQSHWQCSIVIVCLYISLQLILSFCSLIYLFATYLFIRYFHFFFITASRLLPVSLDS